jgi:hypothetical protein
MLKNRGCTAHGRELKRTPQPPPGAHDAPLDGDVDDPPAAENSDTLRFTRLLPHVGHGTGLARSAMETRRSKLDPHFAH